MAAKRNATKTLTLFAVNSYGDVVLLANEPSPDLIFPVVVYDMESLRKLGEADEAGTLIDALYEHAQVDTDLDTDFAGSKDFVASICHDGYRAVFGGEIPDLPKRLTIEVSETPFPNRSVRNKQLWLSRTEYDNYRVHADEPTGEDDRFPATVNSVEDLTELASGAPEINYWESELAADVEDDFTDLIGIDVEPSTAKPFYLRLSK